MLVYALVCYAAVVVVFASATNLLYWYETANAPHKDFREGCKGVSGVLRWIAVGLGSSMLSMVLVSLSYPLGFLARLGRPGPQPARCVVVFTHGLYHNASAWLYFKHLFYKAGYTACVAWSYNSLTRSFLEISDTFKALLLDVAAKHPGASLVLVGHSMGGLLVRAALADPRTAPLAAAAVVMGAPNQGSRLAALAFGKAGRDLVPAGAPRLLNATPAPPDIPKLNIFSPLDNMVLPASALEMPEPGWTKVVTAPVCHVGMLFHRQTAAAVLDFLARNLKTEG